VLVEGLKIVVLAGFFYDSFWDAVAGWFEMG
jgi:hypothetical protein